MPIGINQYPILSPEQANPIGYGLAQGIESRLKRYEAETKRAELPYAGLTKEAEAASKLAYANLLGPQMLTKILTNSPAFMSLTPEKQQQIISAATNVPLSQTATTSNFLSGVQPPQQDQAESGSLSDKLMSLLGQQQAPQQQPQGLSSLAQGIQQGSPQVSPTGKVLASPQWQQGMGANEINGGQGSSVTRQAPNVQLPPEPGMQSTTALNPIQQQALNAGIVEQGKEGGKNRANQQKDFEEAASTAAITQQSIDQVSNSLKNPELANMLITNPILGKMGPLYYSKFGTPEQKELIGNYMTSTGGIIQAAARSFPGQFRKGEQDLLTGMKPSLNDTLDVAKGKLEQLSVLNSFNAERNRRAAQIMDKEHLSSIDAQEKADKQLNGEEIRKNIHDNLYPNLKSKVEKQISISDQPKQAKFSDEDIDHTAQKYGLTRAQVIAKLKQQGKI